ncbi:hypothetical protein LJR220_005443 [Bradyrhizobium sp. LjRoot220]|uniref:hypothetical protein n=1 Tax=Bradyrhizobium sp. LjRoot220 TaxID=3342284 RepID=UPI003ED0E4DF
MADQERLKPNGLPAQAEALAAADVGEHRPRNAEAGMLQLLALALTFFPGTVAAQGLPVETASHIPVALWFIGAAILGLVLAYGIMRNRSRSRAEKQLTDQATKANYANEERDRVKSGAD